MIIKQIINITRSQLSLTQWYIDCISRKWTLSLNHGTDNKDRRIKR